MNKFDIQIVREGTKVSFKVSTDLAYANGGETLFYFSYSCSCTQEADLLQRYLNKAYKETIIEIRRKEFFSGWKHALAKKCGRRCFDWFMQTLKPVSSYDN